jgi:hypothetical protein
MNKKKHRMIYLADDELVDKIKFMREKHQLNVSAVIRDALEKKYQELKNENNKVN